MYNYTPDKIIASLAENNYFANRRIAYAVLNVLRDDASPLLIEGDPGVGLRIFKNTITPVGIARTG